MSRAQLKAFLEAVKADVGLQEKLKAATDADSVVAIAKAAGFVISAEELKKAMIELTDDQLELVEGGSSDLANTLFNFIPLAGQANVLSKTFGGPTIGDLF